MLTLWPEATHYIEQHFFILDTLKITLNVGKFGSEQPAALFPKYEYTTESILARPDCWFIKRDPKRPGPFDRARSLDIALFDRYGVPSLNLTLRARRERIGNSFLLRIPTNKHGNARAVWWEAALGRRFLCRITEKKREICARIHKPFRRELH
jgi:hypothetical protein